MLISLSLQRRTRPFEMQLGFFLSLQSPAADQYENWSSLQETDDAHLPALSILLLHLLHLSLLEQTVSCNGQCYSQMRNCLKSLLMTSRGN